MSHHPELTSSDGGAVLAVHVQAGAGRTEVVGRYGDTLKLRVAAPPTGNRANDAVVALVAKEFNLSRADVSVISGASSRQKRIGSLVSMSPTRRASWIGCLPMCVEDTMTGERQKWRCPPSWESPWMDAGPASSHECPARCLGSGVKRVRSPSHGALTSQSGRRCCWSS